MKRAIWIAMSALALSGCLEESKKLLCTSDEDCPADRTCERLSGLCRPKIGPPTFPMGGAVGAFDCPISRPGQMQSVFTRPGLATVVIAQPSFDRKCDVREPGMDMNQRQEGLQTGCRISGNRFPASGGGMNEKIDFVQLEFQQIDGDPNNPVSLLRFGIRASEFSAGKNLTVPAGATAQYFERCSTDRGDTEFKFRFLATEGSFDIASVDETRAQGRFDIKLTTLDSDDARDFGEACDLPERCTREPCAFPELFTPQCRSGLCQPIPSDQNTGICSGTCENHLDCGYDAMTSPSSYCLIEPGEAAGRCIELCSPEGEKTCRAGSSCRASTDFRDFPGGGGPARCLDNCLRTPSIPPDAECMGRSTMNQDGGTRPPMDGGTRPPMDGGTRPPMDGGTRPPMDASTPPPADSGTRPPMDASTPPPADAGTASSPLGQTCSDTNPCPTGWVCGQALPMSSGRNGFCSMACADDAQCAAGYTGPGRAACGLRLRDVNTGNVAMRTCGIECGFGQNGMCPAGLNCGDLINNMTRRPPPDMQPDYCTE